MLLDTRIVLPDHVYNNGLRKLTLGSVLSIMVFQVVCFVVLLTRANGQNPWPYPFQQQIPAPQQQNGPFPAHAGFMPLGSNGFQPFEGFSYGNTILHNNGPPQQVIPSPRMQLLRIQLSCESVPARQPALLRWVRRDSSTVASTAITIADGTNVVDPVHYAVNLENLPNGATRSVLTFLRPAPDSSQAAYYCQSVSSTASTAESREVYVIGNRQFVNANMAYHAADTFTGHWQQRSATGPITEAVKLVTPNPIHLNGINQGGWMIYHEEDVKEHRTPPMNLRKSVTPPVVRDRSSSVTSDKPI